MRTGNVKTISVEEFESLVKLRIGDKAYKSAIMNEESVDNVARHAAILSELNAIYLKKNTDYGNSFDISLDDDGLLVSKIRLGDKYNRFSSLIKNDDNLVKDESIRDTLIDMANYAIMTVMWMDQQELNKALKDTMEEVKSIEVDWVNIYE